MKFTTTNWTIAIAMLVALSTHPAAQEMRQPTGGHPPTYRVTDLGTLGGTFSAAGGVNNKEWVVGGATLPSGQTHAFLWQKGHMLDLGTFGGPNSVSAYPLSESGVIGGFAETAISDPLGEDFCGFGTHLICLPFVWRNGVKTSLPTLSGNNGEALEVNNRGQIVGLAENDTPDPTCVAPQALHFEPVMWQRGKVVQLPTTGDPDGVAFAINDNGDVVGATGTCAGFIGFAGLGRYSHALLWRHGAVTDLGNLGGTTNNVPGDINNQDQVVGSSNLPGDQTFHAFLWMESSGMQDLGTLPGDYSSTAFAITETGQIVGQSCDVNFNCRAFLWEHGTMTDFNALISANSPLHLLVAESINALGEVVGIGLDTSTGQLHAFLATPA